MIAAPCYEFLFSTFCELPTYLGPPEGLTLITTEAGVRGVEVSGEFQEIVIATEREIYSLPESLRDASEGVYLVGTGSRGIVETFSVLSAFYLTTVTTGAFLMRTPHDQWKPAGWQPPSQDLTPHVTASSYVHYKTVLKTPQFYLLWLSVLGNAVAGVSIISSAKTLMTEIFGASLPEIITGSFAASFVASLSAANMIGRLTWASVSDYTGRKNAYILFGLAIPILYMFPHVTGLITDSSSIFPLFVFCGGTMMVVSFYGGLFSVLPAYIADLYGQKHVGAIHGRLLTAWSASALMGPMLLTWLRNASLHHHITQLTALCDPEIFQSKFGAPISKLPELLESKSITISQLMQIVPPGTVDPTPLLYDTTLITMSGLLTFAFVCNLLIFPVDPKHFQVDENPPQQNLAVPSSVVEKE
eukprot:TRINITY_DN9175_c0_g1_i2.p1 TRINITY_DN9175_c0_g1~~TRINITY_DN9175_c0_g1_i2.p1  ORF type:complete len:416 (+),score=71.82 TRINITY_DN9175_c0_g1_i2:157-1404(+)